MKLANFNSISPDIVWKPRNNENRSSYIWQQIRKSFLSDLRLLIPPAITLIGIGYISTEIFGTDIDINKYLRDHEEYEERSLELTMKEANNGRMKSQVENTRNKLVKSIHPYVFGKELQTIIPKSVQLKRYEVNEKNLFVEAKSYNQKSLDEFIVFLNNHSNVEPNSVNIIELISQTNTEQSMQQVEGINGLSEENRRSYEVKVSAKLRMLNEETLRKKITEFGDFYLLKKLSIFTIGQQP